MASRDRNQIGKRPGQSVQSVAHDPAVVRIVQVSGQGNLRRVVRALHDRHDAALPVRRQGMSNPQNRVLRPILATCVSKKFW